MKEIRIFDNRETAIKIVPENTIKVLRIDGLPVCITRKGDSFFAFEDKCPHMDYPLRESRVSPAGEVVCAWHNYRFSLSDGTEALSRCPSMATYPVWENDQGQIILKIDI